MKYFLIVVALFGSHCFAGSRLDSIQGITRTFNDASGASSLTRRFNNASGSAHSLQKVETTEMRHVMQQPSVNYTVSGANSGLSGIVKKPVIFSPPKL